MSVSVGFSEEFVVERLATKTIPCAECRQGIQTRRDLAVAGKLLQPYHRSCINSPVSKLGRLHRFYGTFPLGARMCGVFGWWRVAANAMTAMPSRASKLGSGTAKSGMSAKSWINNRLAIEQILRVEIVAVACFPSRIVSLS